MAHAVEKALAGEVVGWGAPTYDQVRIAWDESVKAASPVANFVQQRMTAYFPNGGRIIYRSLDDPDNARGHSVNGWILDEVADIKPIAYYDIIFPMLIENEESWFVGSGTPKGRNWFYREWLKAREREDASAWQIPTLGCEIVNGTLRRKPHPYENPFISFAEIQRMFESVPVDTFRQEILAEFIDNQGAVFRNVYDCATSPRQHHPKDHRHGDIYFGVDWGKQNDFTVIIAVCSTCKQVVLFDRFNQIDYTFQRARLAAHRDRWKPAGVLPERNSMGEPIIEMLMQEGIPVINGTDGKPGYFTSPSNKPQLIEDLALTIETGEIKLMDDPVLIGELLAYERKVSASGRPTYSAPEGMHDDSVMALALAWNAQSRGGFNLYEL